MIDAERFKDQMGISGKAASRFLRVTAQSETLATVTFVNMDPARVAEGRGGGAEAHNNQQTFFVRPAPGGRVSVSHAVNALSSSWRPVSVPSLRGRTGAPDAIAAYVGAYVNGAAEAAEPLLTHETPA